MQRNVIRGASELLGKLNDIQSWDRGSFYIMYLFLRRNLEDDFTIESALPCENRLVLIIIHKKIRLKTKCQFAA